MERSSSHNSISNNNSIRTRDISQRPKTTFDRQRPRNTDLFPGAKVDPRLPSEEDQKKQYIYVFNMDPKEVEGFDPYMPASELMTRQVCSINTFYSKTPVRKRRTEGYGEFAEWHRHVTTYTTKQALQGTIRRSEVIKISPVKEMSPIECAVYDTNSKTIELMHQACYYWRCLRFGLDYAPQAVSNFTMLITGIVNAAVNGGTAVFQQIFLESPMSKEPICVKFSQALKNAFSDQLRAVNFALIIHDQIVADVSRPLHEQAKGNFKDMASKMEPVIGKVDFSKGKAYFGEIPPTDFLVPKDSPQEEPSKPNSEAPSEEGSAKEFDQEFFCISLQYF